MLFRTVFLQFCKMVELILHLYLNLMTISHFQYEKSNQSKIFSLSISAVPIKENAASCHLSLWFVSSSTLDPLQTFGFDVCYGMISAARPIRDQWLEPFPFLGLKLMKKSLQTLMSRFHSVSVTSCWLCHSSGYIWTIELSLPTGSSLVFLNGMLHAHSQNQTPASGRS